MVRSSYWEFYAGLGTKIHIAKYSKITNLQVSHRNFKSNNLVVAGKTLDVEPRFGYSDRLTVADPTGPFTRGAAAVFSEKWSGKGQAAGGGGW